MVEDNERERGRERDTVKKKRRVREKREPSIKPRKRRPYSHLQSALRLPAMYLKETDNTI